MALVWFISWLLLAFVVAFVAQGNGRSFGSYFALSFFLSPLVGFLVLIAKGKITQDEILSTNEHIFYCPKCGSTYSSLGEKTEYCPDCKCVVEETTILRDKWRELPKEKKEQMKIEFAAGAHMRNAINVSQSNSSSADELKKFKELLDMGAITQEEYDTKKKEILKL